MKKIIALSAVAFSATVVVPMLIKHTHTTKIKSSL